MVELINDKLNELNALCQRYQVRRLFVFGSILTPRFNADSDIDFAVDFDRENIDNIFRAYCDLHEGLSSLFNRPVDLVDNAGVKNPYFKRELLNTRQLVYGTA